MNSESKKNEDTRRDFQTNLKRPRIDDHVQPIPKKVCKESNYLVICMQCADHFRSQKAGFDPHSNDHGCCNIIDSAKVKTCINVLLDCLTSTPRPSSPMNATMLPPKPPPMSPPLVLPMSLPVSSAKRKPMKGMAQPPSFLNELTSVLLKKKQASMSNSKESQTGSGLLKSVITMEMMKPNALDDLEKTLKQRRQAISSDDNASDDEWADISTNVENEDVVTSNEKVTTETNEQGNAYGAPENTSQSGMKPMPLSEKLKLSKTLDSTKTKKTKPINMENRGENYQNRQLKRSSLNMPINHEKRRISARQAKLKTSTTKKAVDPNNYKKKRSNRQSSAKDESSDDSVILID